VALLELGLMVVFSGVVIAIIYQAILRTAIIENLEEEIRKGNFAIGLLMGMVMVSAGLLLKRGLGASVTALQLKIAAPEMVQESLWFLVLLMLGHLVVSLAISIATLVATLWFFRRLTRRLNPEMQLGELLRQGNIAVAAVLAAVVFLTTTFVGEGVSSVSKALVPQPHIGKIQVME
jgi:uncharacterized membrane protein YjfL (UPF0719 family)